jgi:hypothetical protein
MERGSGPIGGDPGAEEWIGVPGAGVSEARDPKRDRDS